MERRCLKDWKSAFPKGTEFPEELNRKAYDAAFRLGGDNAVSALSKFEEGRWYGTVIVNGEDGKMEAYFEIMSGIAWQWKISSTIGNCQLVVNIKNDYVMIRKTTPKEKTNE